MKFLPILLIVIFFSFSCSYYEQKPASKANKKVYIPEILDSIWIVAVGDVVPGSDYDRIAIPPNEGKDLITDLVPYIISADLAFANFEAIISGCDCEARPCNDPKFCYRFRIPEIYAQRIKEAGFDILNLGCNHIDDFRSAGRIFTKEKLTNLGFQTAGIKEQPCTVFEKNGIRYGFCAFAEFSGCFGMRDTASILTVLRKTVDESDIVIVSLHGGAEGPDYRHTPKTDEIFLDFNRGNMYEIAHLCIDNGADLIIGTGPHVTRAVELYKDRLIMYSLGNFCTYGPFGNHELVRHAPLMRIAVDNKGNFLAGEIIPVKHIGKGMPRYDSSGLAIKHLKEMTLSDFPTTRLFITAEGRIGKY
jgi:hypothetical protein